MPRPRRPRRRPTAEAKAKQKAGRAGGQGARPGRAKRAAQLAAATQRARTSWDSHARPEKLAIVRSRTVDLVTNGSLTQQVPRRQATMTMSELGRYLPNNWLSIEGGTAKLSAAVVLSPGVAMEIGGDVREVRLAGGPKPSDAASIYTGSGKLRVHDVAISSYDPRSGQPLPIGPGRPFIVVSSDGQMDAVDATFSDLGTPIEPDDRPGVLFGINSSGSMVRTTLLRNSTGLKLDRSNAIRLDAVTVERVGGRRAGAARRQGHQAGRDQGRAQRRQRRAGGGREHVPARSPGSPPPATVGSGWSWPRRTSRAINGIVSVGDGAGGLRLSRSDDAVVTDVTATD